MTLLILPGVTMLTGLMLAVRLWFDRVLGVGEDYRAKE